MEYGTSEVFLFGRTGARIRGFDAQAGEEGILLPPGPLELSLTRVDARDGLVLVLQSQTGPKLQHMGSYGHPSSLSSSEERSSFTVRLEVAMMFI